jgi:1,3-alpha-isomaltosidase
MIRHRPFGSGHPYSVDTEQRSPVDPVANKPVVLGVRTSPGVVSVSCELVRHCAPAPAPEPETAESSETVALERVARSHRGQNVDGGHLAGAQARLARSAGGWQARIDGLRPHETVDYQFTASAADGSIERTRWFSFRVAEWRNADPSILTVTSGASTSVTRTARPAVVDRLTDGVQVLDDGERLRRVRFSLRLEPGEHVAGFGERFDRLDHRGTSLDSMVFEQYKSQGAERKTYLPMPFAHVVGGSGWGFHVRTSRRVWFDIGETAPGLIRIEAELDAPSDSTDVLGLALYSGSPTEVLDAFLADTGRPRELPDWVFQLWASGNEWNTQTEVLRQAALHREHGIPIGALVIEAWSDESTFTAFRDSVYKPRERPLRLADLSFPAEGAWPDPKGMVDQLHVDGTHVILWQIPLIKMRPHPTGQTKIDAAQGIRDDHLIRETAPDGSLRPYRNRGWWFPLGLMPDLTDESAARWWTDKRRYLVEEIGVDGFKTDGGEHAWGRDLRYLDGTHGDEGNNRFPVAYAKAFGDLLESAGKAPVTFSRAGFVGSAPHGAFWAGDENSTWDAFRWSLFAGLSASASGILYWGWDLAGFSGDVPSAELYLRSAAAAAFVPIMQYHSEFNHHRTPSRDRTPWNIAETSGDDRVIPVFRRFVELRERLRPYLRCETREAIAQGAPLMRPLYFDFPSDPAVWDRPVQWMLGSKILVSPVTEPGVSSWSTYLPLGEWVDAWTGAELTGGLAVERPAPLDQLPVYVRADAWSELRAVFES